MKVTMICTVAVDLEVDEDLKNEIREAMDLEDDKGPTAEDVKDYFTDQAQDNLEELMSNYGFSCDDCKITVK